MNKKFDDANYVNFAHLGYRLGWQDKIGINKTNCKFCGQLINFIEDYIEPKYCSEECERRSMHCL